MCAVVVWVAVGSSGAAARSGSTQARLSLDRIIPTSPFVGSTTIAGDNEDIAYVASDDAFWIADDNVDAIYEVDRRTGALLTEISQSSFMAAAQLNVGGLAPQSRSEDLEALAYDATADLLYAFSGSTNALPTVYRLARDASHHFGVESWQPLPSEWTGAAWRPADQQLYMANGSELSTFDYATDTVGPSFSIPGLDKVTGIAFDESTGELIAVNQRLYRVAMDTRAIRSGWKALRLKVLGIQDSRGVAIVDHQIFISDGSEARAPGDPNDHAIFVIDVTDTDSHTRHARKASSRSRSTEPNRQPVNRPAAPASAGPDDPQHGAPQSNRPPVGAPGSSGHAPEHSGPKKPLGPAESEHKQKSSDDKQQRAPQSLSNSKALQGAEPKDNGGHPSEPDH